MGLRAGGRPGLAALPMKGVPHFSRFSRSGINEFKPSRYEPRTGTILKLRRPCLEHRETWGTPQKEFPQHSATLQAKSRSFDSSESFAIERFTFAQDDDDKEL